MTSTSCVANEVADGQSCVCAPGYYRNQTTIPNGAQGIYNLTRAACVPCAPGSAKSVPGDSPSSCMLCESGKFSLYGWVSCVACLSNARCSVGLLRIQPGLWWPPANVDANGFPMEPTIINTTVLLPCPTATSCLYNTLRPGYNNLTILDAPPQSVYSSCAPGTRGPMCSACDPGFAGQNGKCAPCISKLASWSITVFGFVFLVVVVGFLVKRSAAKRSKFMSVVRVLLNWLQVRPCVCVWPLRLAHVCVAGLWSGLSYPE